MTKERHWEQKSRWLCKAGSTSFKHDFRDGNRLRMIINIGPTLNRKKSS